MKYGKVFVVALTLLACAIPALAQQAPAVVEKQFEFKSMSAGDPVNAEGLVKLKWKLAVETFAVRVSAEVPDGTLYVVSVRTEQGEADVGAISMLLGSGSLVLRSSRHDSKVFPLDQLLEVTIKQDGEMLLWSNVGPDAR